MTILAESKNNEYAMVRDFDIICFGDSDWWYHNRGHMDIQLMKRYAKTGSVLYINSIVVRKFNVLEGGMFIRRVKRKLHSIMQGIKPSGVKNMMVYSPFSMPVHHISGARQLNAFVMRSQVRHCMRRLNMEKVIIWVACPGAAEVAIKLPHSKLIYQRSDRYEEFPGVDADQMIRYDRLLKAHADLVIYSNEEFMAQESSQCSKAIYLDHGVDYELFAAAEQDDYIPEKMRQIQHPILGFYGGIDDHTSNIALIEEVADLLPDFSVVLIGSASVDVTGLGSRKNVYMLGQKAYEDIPHYGKCFDVCFMPWQQNEWIMACNPVKFKEYLALGKPIVSTSFSELGGYDGFVEVANDADSFASAVRKVLKENNSELAAARRKRVAGHTWESRAKLVFDNLLMSENEEISRK